MTFDKKPRVIYEKNLLDKVICQLRFPPILKIDSGSPVDFQESIRVMFPFYNEKVEIVQGFPNKIFEGSPQNISTNISKTEPHKIHIFSSADKVWDLNLTRTFLSITTTKYTRWEDFIKMLENPLKSLIEIYKPPFFTRIGLRYIDIFDRSKLGLQGLPWTELINSDFLGLLSSPISDDIRNFESKYEITLEDKSSILRIVTSLVYQMISHEQCYLVDCDFFYPKRIDTNDSSNQLEFLHEQASRLIHFIITDRLHNEMKPTNP